MFDLKGKNALVTGASGGVGSAVVQLAKRRGARVTAIAGQTKVAAVMAVYALALAKIWISRLMGSFYGERAAQLTGPDVVLE